METRGISWPTSGCVLQEPGRTKLIVVADCLVSSFYEHVRIGHDCWSVDSLDADYNVPSRYAGCVEYHGICGAQSKITKNTRTYEQHYDEGGHALSAPQGRLGKRQEVCSSRAEDEGVCDSTDE